MAACCAWPSSVNEMPFRDRSTMNTLMCSPVHPVAGPLWVARAGGGSPRGLWIHKEHGYGALPDPLFPLDLRVRELLARGGCVRRDTARAHRRDQEARDRDRLAALLSRR